MTQPSSGATKAAVSSPGHDRGAAPSHAAGRVAPSALPAPLVDLVLVT